MAEALQRCFKMLLLDIRLVVFTNVIETTWMTPQGWLRVVDALTIGPAALVMESLLNSGQWAVKILVHQGL